MKKIFLILIIILLILIIVGILYQAYQNDKNIFNFLTSTPLTPGYVTPGSVTPGSITPGSVTPGSITPGSITPGSITPGSKLASQVFECPSNNGGVAPNCAKNYINTAIATVPPRNCCLPDPNAGNPDEVTKRLEHAKYLVTQIAVQVGFDMIAKYVAYRVIGVSEKVASEIFLKTTGEFAASIGEKIGFNSFKNIFFDINRAGIQVTEKLGLGVGEKIVVDTSAKVVVGAGEKVAIGAGEKVAVGAGEKVAIGAGEKVAIGVGEKAAVTTGVAVGKTWAEFGMDLAGGPVGLALLAVQILSLGLDLAHVGNYDDITYLDTWRKFKEKINTTIENKVIENGGTLPGSLIRSPINKFPSGIDVSGNPLPETIAFIDKFKASTSDKTIVLPEPTNKYEVTRMISIRYIINYMSLILKNMDTQNLTDIDFENVKTQLIKEATDYLTSQSGSDYIYETLCNYFPNSKMIEINGQKYCTYKDKQSCDASYDWDKLKKCLSSDNKECNETYVQWITDASNNSYCKYTSFAMKSSCEEKGLPYDYDKEICTITPDYCKGKAVDYTTDSDGLGNCKIGVGQDIAEMILGTTITRGLIQVFDPGQYENCPEGWYDGANLPEELKIAMGLGVLLPPPLNIIPIMYETMGNKMCVSKYRCLDGLENSGGLCYPPCKSGFKSDDATQCYKQYPGSNGTLIDIYMGSETKAPTVMDTCPPGQNKAAPGGLICYRDCQPGYHPNATGETCVEDCPPGYDLNGTMTCGLKVHAVTGTIPHMSGGGCHTYIDHGDRDMYGNGKLKTDCDPITSDCPSGQQNLAGLCYNCPAGTSPQSPGFCSQGGALTIQTKTYPREIGDAIGCSPNKQKVNGMCYDKCSPGYSMGPGGQGICYQQCPAGSKPTNLVDNSASATCLRESYNRGAGLVPFDVKFKNRKIAFSK